MTAGLLLVATLVLVGCSRSWNRRRADREATCLIEQKGGYLDGGTVYAPPNSRMYDPFCIDCPPMPPDDPRSHQLMHCVDGKRGWKHWNRNGTLGSVETDGWLASLPTDDDGTVTLDLADAVRVSRINSRDYQRNCETLYRSALDVSFERFRFDHQFYAGASTFQSHLGRDIGATSPLAVRSFAGFNKLNTAGGEIVVGFANSLLFDFWGTDSNVLTSAIDFSLIQPLLRFGGRARVMERLTQSERTLLANVRQMEQYRQGFYVNIVTGRNSGSGPSLSDVVGQNGLGLIAGFPSGRTGVADAGGYLGLLQDQQQIRNQTTNIVALRDSLAQLEAAFDANRINSRLQVDQARQALLNAQSGLLSSKSAYQSRLDSFKMEMGLPPDLPLEIRDTLLDRFVLISPELTELQEELAEILLLIRKGRTNPTDALIVNSVESVSAFQDRIAQRVASAEEDVQDLDTRLPERREQLQKVKRKIEELGADVDPRVYEETSLMRRIGFLLDRLPHLKDEIAEVIDSIDGGMEEIEEGEDGELSPMKRRWKKLNKYATKLSDLLLELSLLQAEVRLQGITLMDLELDPIEAIEVARVNRLDWMNARANLVDSWRNIEFIANELKSDLDIVVTGQLGTRSGNIVDFRKDNSRIRFGAQFDTPTARLVERNRYREALIDYQESRRAYMLFEDRVKQSLRNTLRIVTLNQINLEVRRVAVQVAIAQVDIARLKLNPPLRPGQANQGASPTAARDLVSALSDLLDAQNDFLNVWVSYEVMRILVDFEMGTMQLDPTGIWLDPGPIEGSPYSSPQSDENLLEPAFLESVQTEAATLHVAKLPFSMLLSQPNESVTVYEVNHRDRTD
ncbi:hypothetical protein [Novipirellula artificiosorum]|uniref:Outer membrane efflux protein n=1 Tax=Novipirellula artificiosorum TaxID=2528016 RepID=A0A5C6E643_9BACT|nr:hypothetical protein [Novipirellula artificiosorum]TWU42609.1 hypothetical protein Poly41_09070 [Novipirellula artificiosorum]